MGKAETGTTNGKCLIKVIMSIYNTHNAFFAALLDLSAKKIETL